MKKIPCLYVLFMLFLCSIGLFAQDTSSTAEFKVSENDFRQNSYPKDSLATALILYESGESSITQSDNNILTKYKKKIKILKTEGYKYATVKIHLFRNRKGFETVRKIKATSYTKENGKIEVVQLEKAHIFKEKVNENYNSVTFTLPNIKVGTVLTYSYTLESPFIFNFHEWEFQEDIPKIYSEFQTSIPGNYNYNIKLVGIKKLDTHTNSLQKKCFTHGAASADCAEALYAMHDIPAFVEEDYMTSKDNYLSKLEYELMQIKYFDGRVDDITKSWKNAEREIKSTSLGKELRKTSRVKDLIKSEVSLEQDPLNKAKLIYHYVQENYTWNGDCFLFQNVSIKNLLKEKTGPISSVNTLLHNLLKENGFEVYPVISSTRKNGLPTKLFPVLSEFNYLLVLVQIDGKQYLLDASDKFVSFGQIPYRCLNEYGRKIDFKEGSEWCSLAYNKPSRNYIDLNLKFTKPSIISGTVQRSYSGYHALLKKQSYYTNPESYLSTLENSYQDIVFKDYKCMSKGVEDDRFMEAMHLTKEYELETENDLYLDPFLFRFFTINPFQLQNRTYPVDFGYKDSYCYKLNLDVGGFYKFGELPQNYRMRLPEGKAEITCRTLIIENKLSLTFKIDFKESKYSSAWYEGLKEIMAKAVNTQLNSILILNKV